MHSAHCSLSKMLGIFVKLKMESFEEYNQTELKLWLVERKLCPLIGQLRQTLIQIIGANLWNRATDWSRREPKIWKVDPWKIRGFSILAVPLGSFILYYYFTGSIL